MGRWLLALVMLVSGVSCGGEAGTAVRVRVEVDPGLGAQLLRVRVFDTNRALALDETVALGAASLPIVVPLFPDGEGERSYHVVMEALDSSGARVGTQRVIAGYVADERRVLHARFDAACASTTCSGRETCRVEGGEPVCVHACFEPQLPNETALPISNTCPTEVYVHAESGVDDPSACFGPDAPCASVQYALDSYLAGAAGGTVQIAGGMTYDPFFLRGRRDGEPDADVSGDPDGAPTVIRAWPGTGRPRIDGRGESNGIGTCCSGNAANHFVLDGLDVVRARNAGIRLHGDAVTDVVVRDCTVSGTVVVAEAMLNPNQVAGIVVTNGASRVQLLGNEVRENRSETTVGSQVLVTHGIAVTGSSVTVEGNVVADNLGDGVHLAAGRDLAVLGNLITGSGRDGIRLVSGASVVESSRLLDNRICGSVEQGVDVEGARDLEVVHNSVVQNGSAGLLARDSSTDLSVVANLFAYNGEAGLARVLDEESEPTDRQNLYWMNAAGAYANTTPDGEDWVGAHDPMFVDLSACDLALGEGSSAAGLVDGGPVGARGR